MAKFLLQIWHLLYQAPIDHSNSPLGTENSHLINIDEKRNDTCHICTLNKLTMDLVDALYLSSVLDFATEGEFWPVLDAARRAVHDVTVPLTPSVVDG